MLNFTIYRILAAVQTARFCVEFYNYRAVCATLADLKESGRSADDDVVVCEILNNCPVDAVLAGADS